MRRSITVILAATALLVPAAADAKAPPKGEYGCTIGGTYFGQLTIKGGNKYRRNGKTGTFSAKGTHLREGGIKAFKIRFKTGGFKGFKGDWRKTDGGDVEIALKNPIDDFESIYCVEE